MFAISASVFGRISILVFPARALLSASIAAFCLRILAKISSVFFQALAVGESSDPSKIARLVSAKAKALLRSALAALMLFAAASRPSVAQSLMPFKPAHITLTSWMTTLIDMGSCMMTARKVIAASVITNIILATVSPKPMKSDLPSTVWLNAPTSSRMSAVNDWIIPDSPRKKS